MATSVSEILTRVAYRQSEDSSPTASSETNRRLSFLNEGLFNIIGKNYWWFTETTATFDSVASQESYTTADGFPSDIRGSAILELRYNGTLYTPIQQTDAFNTYSSTYTNHNQSYFVFNKSLYPVPAFPASGTDNIAIKYYKMPARLVSSDTSVIIPDEYTDLLVSFVVGRIFQIDGERGSAADAFEEYAEWIKILKKAQNDYYFALKARGVAFDLQSLYE